MLWQSELTFAIGLLSEPGNDVQ